MSTSIAVRFPVIRLTRSSPLTRFIGVGVVSTCAYALLFVALSGPLGSVVASAIALIVTAVANTAANRRLTFGVRGRAGLVRQAGLVVFGVALALTTGHWRPCMVSTHIRHVAGGLGRGRCEPRCDGHPLRRLSAWVFRARTFVLGRPHARPRVTLAPMSIVTPELRALIDSGPLAHVVTINPDGSPQVTVVWIALDGDDVVSGHMSRYRKLRNAERDPRISISIEAPPQPDAVMADYAVLYGTATVETGGAPDLLATRPRLCRSRVRVPARPRPRPGYVLRTRIERVTGHGPWAGGQ